MVSIESDRSRAVPPIMASTRIGETRNSTAEHSIANSADVPEADSRFSVNFAAYGEACATTGGSLRISPSTPGQGKTNVALSSSALTGP